MIKWVVVTYCKSNNIICSLYITVLFFRPQPQQVNNINANMSLADKTEAVIRDLQEEDTMSNLKKTFAGIFGDM